jgi:hypothetical protein
LNAAMASDDTLKKFEEELGEKVNTAQMADNGDMLTAKEAVMYVLMQIQTLKF